MAMKSTLGAPLTEAEEAEIHAAYVAVRDYVNNYNFIGDAVKIYEHGDKLIALGFELRNAVQDAWREANQRQVRNVGLAMRAAANSLKPKPAPKDGDAILKELGL